MTTDSVPMTVKGKQVLDAELKKLIQVDRQEVVRSIEEARAHGDISENAEYNAAKERQSWIESRINELQDKLSRAQVIDTSTIKSNKIMFGATVKVEDLEKEETHTYRIVGADEADVGKGLLSIMSPLSRGLIGKKVGDEVEVKAPTHDKIYKVISLRYE